MSQILDPITSALSSILSVPNTATTSTAQPSVKSKTASQATLTNSQTASQTKASLSTQSSTPIPNNLPSNIATSQETRTTSTAPTTTSSSNIPSSITSPLTTASSSTVSSSTSLLADITTVQTRTAASITSTESSTVSSITSTSSTDTSTSSSTITTAPSTTLATSTISSSTSSLSTTSATTSATQVASNSTADANKVPTAGIIVAAVMGFLIIATMLFLIFRYCAPIRRKYDSWQEKKRLARTYREAIDGAPDSSDKLNRDESPYSAYSGHRFYADDSGNHSAGHHQAQGTGLGLGNRLSMLMQHAPFQSGNQNNRPSQIGMAVTQPIYHGPYSSLPR